jgi:hypothetical protein
MFEALTDIPHPSGGQRLSVGRVIMAPVMTYDVLTARGVETQGIEECR